MDQVSAEQLYVPGTTDPEADNRTKISYKANYLLVTNKANAEAAGAA